jgi:nitrogen regulatory protein PII
MTRVEAIVPPHMLDLVRQTLADLGLQALTACEVKGMERGAPPARTRGQAVANDLRPWLKLEVVIPSPFLPRVLDALARAARGGQIAGRIFASPVDEVIRIRTGERGEGAL